MKFTVSEMFWVRYLFKCIGVLTVVLCLSVLGFLKSYSKREQIKRLKALDSALSRANDMLRLGVQSRGEIIGECFGQVANTSVNVAFTDKTAGQANAVLDKFLSEFGSGDRELEYSRINRVKKELAALISANEAEYEQFSKIWRTTGVCAGLCLGIMLI